MFLRGASKGGRIGCYIRLQEIATLLATHNSFKLPQIRPCQSSALGDSFKYLCHSPQRRPVAFDPWHVRFDPVIYRIRPIIAQKTKLDERLSKHWISFY